jgi:hypothetical protein
MFFSRREQISVARILVAFLPELIAALLKTPPYRSIVQISGASG